MVAPYKRVKIKPLEIAITEADKGMHLNSAIHYHSIMPFYPVVQTVKENPRPQIKVYASFSKEFQNSNPEAKLPYKPHPFVSYDVVSLAN